MPVFLFLLVRPECLVDLPRSEIGGFFTTSGEYRGPE